MGETPIATLRLPDCACRNLRMTARVITQYYDKMLLSTGLKITQFTFLNTIAYYENGLSVNQLAEVSKMDQTTVTRNVDLLKKSGDVTVFPSPEDNRRKIITLSEQGRSKIQAAMPYWTETQQKIEQAVGKSEYNTFLNVLELIQSLSENEL